MQTTSSIDVLPPYFPLVRKECESTADVLFKCLGDKSEPAGDKRVAAEALTTCKDPLASYMQCTEKSLNAKGAKKPIALTEWEKE